MREPRKAGGAGCLLPLVVWTAVVAGVLFTGLYCGDNTLAWVVALAVLAVGPIAGGVAVYQGLGGRAIIRATAAILVVAASLAGLALLAFLINFSHCPLF